MQIIKVFPDVQHIAFYVNFCVCEQEISKMEIKWIQRESWESLKIIINAYVERDVKPKIKQEPM